MPRPRLQLPVTPPSQEARSQTYPAHAGQVYLQVASANRCSNSAYSAPWNLEHSSHRHGPLHSQGRPVEGTRTVCLCRGAVTCCHVLALGSPFSGVPYRQNLGCSDHPSASLRRPVPPRPPPTRPLLLAKKVRTIAPSPQPLQPRSGSPELVPRDDLKPRSALS